MEIANSASKFGKLEESLLKIGVEEVDFINQLIPLENFSEISHKLSLLELSEFDKEKIILFNPKKYQLSRSQKMFLNRLRAVLINNDIQNSDSNLESLIDELVRFLYEEADFDDGEDLTMNPCNLRLEIGDDSYASYGDREGRRGTEIIWVLCEDKHRSSRKYKKGEIQLISCMIAAAQWNKSIDNNHPKYIVGIRVIGDRFCFYSSEISDEYLDQLVKGFPKIEVKVRKYPKGDGFRLSDINERRNILSILETLRKYALELTPFYTDY